MSIHMYIYISIYLYLTLYTSTHTHIYIYIYTYLYIFGNVHARLTIICFLLFFLFHSFNYVPKGCAVAERKVLHGRIAQFEGHSHLSRMEEVGLLNIHIEVNETMKDLRVLRLITVKWFRLD